MLLNLLLNDLFHKTFCPLSVFWFLLAAPVQMQLYKVHKLYFGKKKGRRLPTLLFTQCLLRYWSLSTQPGMRHTPGHSHLLPESEA